ncbi:unnamed protein product [Boreogadus saida]
MAKFEDPLPGSALDEQSRVKILESKVNVSKTTVSLATVQDVWKERHVQELGKLPWAGAGRFGALGDMTLNCALDRTFKKELIFSG